MNELQVKVLGLLKDFDRLCRENDVEYYLTAGTLIGALRHKGFIPWDDDADVIMTRKNWEKFLERTEGKLPENIVINSQSNDDSLAMTANHYVDTSTTALYRYEITNPERSGIMLDLIIIDPVPAGAESKEEYVDALTKHTELSTLAYQYSLRTGKNTHFARYWRLSKLFGMRKVWDHIDRKAFHYTEEESAFLVQRFAGSPHFWPKEIFGKPKYVPFEDTMLPVPERAEDCLCIGYDDDWMYIPRGGPSKSTHDFCVRSLTLPSKYITEEFEKHIDRKKVRAVYINKKKIQVAQTKDRNRVLMESDKFAVAKTQLVYEKKLVGADLQTLIETKDYSALEEFFAEYIEIQCTSKLLGSSSLTGPLNWRRKCEPMLIDIGDEALYAVLLLLLHKQKLAWSGRLLKARKALDRPLTNELKEMDGLYGAIKAATSAYDCGEDEQCRIILDEWLPRWSENPFLLKLDLKEKIRQGLEGKELLDALSDGLELFPEDSELLYLQAQEMLRMGDQEKALELFRNLIDTSNHGIVLLHIRETLEALIEREPMNRTLYELWRDLRVATGEEDVPKLKDLLPDELRRPEDFEEASESDQSLDEDSDQEEEMISEENPEPAEQVISEKNPEQAEQMISGENPEQAEQVISGENPEPAEQVISGENPEPAEQVISEENSEQAEQVISEENSEQVKQETVTEALIPQEQPVPQDLPLTAVQERRLQLLQEFDGLCRSNDINYFLFSKALYQAARFGKYIDPNADITVCMTPGNYRKFEKAFRQAKFKNRYLDSMRTNPMFHRFCVRYCDTESTDFFVAHSGCGKQFGIFITIEILRNPSRSKFENNFNRALEFGWETSIRPRPSTSRWERFGKLFVSILCCVFGRKRVGKLLFCRFLSRPKKFIGETQFIKPYLKERVKFSHYLFRYMGEVELEGISFQTMQLYTAYLKSTYGAKWRTKKFPMTKENPFNRIVDADIPSREYLSYLRDKGIHREEFWKLRRRNERKLLPAVELNNDTSYYWDLLCLCGERYRLAEKYLPMRLYLVELYNSNQVKKLMRLLGDYYKTAVAFSKKEMGLCFDPQIFLILEYCLYATGKVSQAKKMKSLIPEQDWRTLTLPGSMGGSGMRKATENDIPAILVYLKRQVQDCLYMYIDIAKYGLENPNMEVWLDSDKNGVKLVVMKYHTSISVYTDREKWDVEKVAKLIREKHVNSVTARKDIIEKLHELCSDLYSVSYGSVHRFTQYRDFGLEDRIETAVPEETLEIAKLITLDEEIGSYYDVQNLADQLTERMNTGMGRSYIIREDGKIIAHIASYAEFDGLATTAGLIVDPAYRNGVYGSALEGYLVKALQADGFEIYTFVTERLRKKLLIALGNQCVGEYGKMALKAEEEESGGNE